MLTRATNAIMVIDRATIPTGDAMSYRADAAKLLDIEVDQLAGVLALSVGLAVRHLGHAEFEPARGQMSRMWPCLPASADCTVISSSSAE